MLILQQATHLPYTLYSIWKIYKHFKMAAGALRLSKCWHLMFRCPQVGALTLASFQLQPPTAGWSHDSSIPALRFCLSLGCTTEWGGLIFKYLGKWGCKAVLGPWFLRGHGWVSYFDKCLKCSSATCTSSSDLAKHFGAGTQVHAMHVVQVFC